MCVGVVHSFIGCYVQCVCLSYNGTFCLSCVVRMYAMHYRLYRGVRMCCTHGGWWCGFKCLLIVDVRMTVLFYQVLCVSVCVCICVGGEREVAVCDE